MESGARRGRCPRRRPVVRGGHESLDLSAAAGDHLHPGQVADRRYVVEVRQRGRHGAQRPDRVAHHPDHSRGPASPPRTGSAQSGTSECRLQLPTGGGVVEQDAHDLGARNPVHRSVMHLRQHRHRSRLAARGSHTSPTAGAPGPDDWRSNGLPARPAGAGRPVREARPRGRGSRRRRCRRQPSTDGRGRAAHQPVATARGAAGGCARSPAREPAPHRAVGPMR